VTDITDAMLMRRLLEWLFESGVVLVTTSNLQPDELYMHGLQREQFLPAIALLKQKLQVVNIDGGVDYRLRALEQAGVIIPGFRKPMPDGEFDDRADGVEYAARNRAAYHPGRGSNGARGSNFGAARRNAGRPTTSSLRGVTIRCCYRTCRGCALPSWTWPGASPGWWTSSTTGK
jgi:hypothetical protein